MYLILKKFALFSLLTQESVCTAKSVSALSLDFIYSYSVVSRCQQSIFLHWKSIIMLQFSSNLPYINKSNNLFEVEIRKKYSICQVSVKIECEKCRKNYMCYIYHLLTLTQFLMDFTSNYFNMKSSSKT